MFFGSEIASIMLNQSHLYIYFLLIDRSNKFAIKKKQMNNKLIFNYGIFEFSWGGISSWRNYAKNKIFFVVTHLMCCDVSKFTFFFFKDLHSLARSNPLQQLK